MGEPEEAAGVAVSATGFGLDGPRGRVFDGVDVDAGPGALIAVEGPSGSGRTCLLLALTGRMKPSEGRAAVGPFHLPRQMAAVRAISALAHVPGVTDLEPALTVGEHLLERALLRRRFTGPLRDGLRALLRPRAERLAEARGRVDLALAAVGLDLTTLPKGARTAVRDLERLEALRLSLALALVDEPRLLAVDDTDLKLSDAERAEVWALLRSLADSGPTVLAVCSRAPEDAVVVSTRPAPGETDPDAPDDARPGDARDVGTADGDEADEADDDGADGTHGTHGDDDDKETADALAETGRA
ncbi:ATP-binding cassette domain-containing protein [Streptomyces sp. NPDC054842]